MARQMDGTLVYTSIDRTNQPIMLLPSLQAFLIAYMARVKLSSSTKARRKWSGLTGRVVLTTSRDVPPPPPAPTTTPPTPSEETVVLPSVVVVLILPLAVLLVVVVVVAAASVTPALAAW